MSKTIQEERLRWVLPVMRGEIKLNQAMKVCPYGRRSLERWLAQYKQLGEAGLFPQSTRPRTQPKETPIRVKERIVELRKQSGKCAYKLTDDLRAEGIYVSVRLVGKVFKQEGLTRKYRTRKVKMKYMKVPLANGDLVEIDIKYVPRPLSDQQYYQFTAIDCASRWRYLSIYDHAGSFEAVSFLDEVMKIAPFRIRAIKTDNGACFTNRYTGYQKSSDPLNPRLHAFDLSCQAQNIIHYLIDPGKPAQNGKVERSHRSDQESFYDQVKFESLEELKLKLKLWNMYYNDLQHCGLNNKTPNQMLEILPNQKPPKVCA